MRELTILFLALLWVTCPPGRSSGEELPASLQTQQKHTHNDRHTVILSEKNRVVLDKGHGISQIVRNDEVISSVLERKEAYALAHDQNQRGKLYSEEVVLFSLSNVAANEKSIAVVHRIRNGATDTRIVQFLDSDLKVQAAFEDELPWSPNDYRLGAEPIAMNDAGVLAGLGEYGEIVVYARDGSVSKCIVVDGIFSEAREPLGFTVDEKLNYHLSADILELTRRDMKRKAEAHRGFLKGRDQVCSGKRLRVAHFDYDNINGLCFLPDRSLNVFVGSDSIRSIDMESGKATVYSVSDLIKKDINYEDERIYQVLCKDWDIYALTLHRVVHLRMSSDFQKVSQLAVSKQADSVGQWNVLPGADRNTEAALFVDFTHLGKRALPFPETSRFVEQTPVSSPPSAISAQPVLPIPTTDAKPLRTSTSERDSYMSGKVVRVTHSNFCYAMVDTGEEIVQVTGPPCDLRAGDTIRFPGVDPVKAPLTKQKVYLVDTIVANDLLCEAPPEKRLVAPRKKETEADTIWSQIWNGYVRKYRGFPTVSVDPRDTEIRISVYKVLSEADQNKLIEIMTSLKEQNKWRPLSITFSKEEVFTPDGGRGKEEVLRVLRIE